MVSEHCVFHIPTVRNGMNFQNLKAGAKSLYFKLETHCSEEGLPLYMQHFA